LLARDLEGTLEFDVETRVITNGSIYIELAHLTTGQEFLLALPDERSDFAGDGPERGAAVKLGVGGTFSPHHPASAPGLDRHWQFAARAGGHRLLPRAIRYIEDRRAEQERFPGASERHPSPLGIVWGAVDTIAIYDMATRLAATRPDARLITLDDV